MTACDEKRRFWGLGRKLHRFVALKFLPDEVASKVWEQPLTCGTPQQVTKFTSGLIFDFACSRDRKQLVLAKGNRTSDVILISNFK